MRAYCTCLSLIVLSVYRSSARLLYIADFHRKNRGLHLKITDFARKITDFPRKIADFLRKITVQ